LKELGQNMTIAYEEWRKTDLIERVYSIVPKIVEKWRLETQLIELTIEETKEYIKLVEKLKRAGVIQNAEAP